MKKGFTLFELLAVLIIIGILVGITIPSVLKIIESRKQTLYESTIKELEKVAKIYLTDNINLYSKLETDEYIDVTTHVLCAKKYTTCPIIDPRDNSIIKGKIRVTFNNDEYSYVFSNIEPRKCDYSGTLIEGTEYIDGQYTYRYKKRYNGSGWENMNLDGWGVTLTNKNSTDAVTTPLCIYIKNKPIVSMHNMFYQSNAVSIDLSSFDTSNVSEMGRMFGDAKSLYLDVSYLDTSKVLSMWDMFSLNKAIKIDGLDLFDTSNVTYMGSVFSSSSVQELDLSNWNTSKVTSMAHMFYNSDARLINISGFDTSNVTNISNMFYYSKADTVIGLNRLNTSNVTTMENLFAETKFDIDVSSFNTSKVEMMKSMFWNTKCSEIKGLNKLNTSNVTSFEGMFAYAKANTLDVSHFDTSKATTMRSMFHTTSATQIIGLTNFNTNLVNDMNGMFAISNVDTLDLSSFDINNETNIDGIVWNAKAITGYAKTQAEANRLNGSSGKPATLTFVVK